VNVGGLSNARNSKYTPVRPILYRFKTFFSFLKVENMFVSLRHLFSNVRNSFFDLTKKSEKECDNLWTLGERVERECLCSKCETTLECNKS
jgi:hypothetical protein